MQTSIKMKYAGKAHEVSISTLGISGAKLSLFCMGCSLVLSLLETPEQTLTGCWTRSTGELKAQLAPSKPLCPHPGSMLRENRQDQHPRKNSFVKFTTQVTCNPYRFKKRLSVSLSPSFSLSLHGICLGSRKTKGERGITWPVPKTEAKSHFTTCGILDNNNQIGHNETTNHSLKFLHQ